MQLVIYSGFYWAKMNRSASVAADNYTQPSRLSPLTAIPLEEKVGCLIYTYYILVLYSFLECLSSLFFFFFPLFSAVYIFSVSGNGGMSRVPFNTLYRQTATTPYRLLVSFFVLLCLSLMAMATARLSSHN